MTNFVEITETFMKNQACLEIADQAGMINAVDHLLSYPDECMKLGQAANWVADSKAGVLDGVMAELDPYLKGGH
jgi:3-deoxy-D-manno-octulosonic-acid transferase